MATKERHIPLKTHEVRGVLEGRKTQIRRVMKDIIWDAHEGPCRVRLTHEDHKGDDVRDDFNDGRIRCPYGDPGDRLWVREKTYKRQLLSLLTGEPLVQNYNVGAYSADDRAVLSPEGFDIEWWYPCKVCPSTQMPRFASRIDLEVTGLRVERLQDISEADARAEGVDPIREKVPTYRDAYRYLWDDINGHGSWDANPFVWVVEFRRINDGR